MTGAALQASVQVRRPAFVVEIDLSATAGTLVAVLGPNAAGKSTLLRALAGLVPLAGGQVRLGTQLLDDPAQRVHVPAARRPVAMVFQDYLLFPHLSARDNVAFGLRARGLDRARARAAAEDVLARMGLADVAAVRPRRLSGGQAQRVALARALAVEPSLLLLDEPLAALDAGTRSTVRSELHRSVRSYPGVSVLVTHDPLDALILADTVVVVEAGRVVQTGTPADIAQRPQTDYVARLMGLNLLAGRASHGVVELDGGGRLAVPEAAGSGAVHVAVRPSAVTLHPARPAAASARNTWAGRVTNVEARGDRVRISVAGPPDVVTDVTATAVAELRLTPGAAVWCAVKATDVDVYAR